MIRKLQLEDKEIFIQFCKEFYHTDAVAKPVEADCFIRTFHALMSNQPMLHGYILEIDGVAVGYGLVSMMYSNEVGGMVLWLEELYIRADYRGQGLGKKYFAFIHETFQNDVKRFRLEATPENKKAIALYRSLGYEELRYSQMILDM